MVVDAFFLGLRSLASKACSVLIAALSGGAIGRRFLFLNGIGRCVPNWPS